MIARPPTLLLALAGLVVCSPIFIILAISIRCTLGRPVLFRQHRAGQSGKPFMIVKFRTMTDARSADGELLPDAARTPAIGRFIRRTRLDELPELWNILRGEMAFIGPRPLLPSTVAAMGEPGRRRGWLLPGLTGWAQVNGNALLTDEDKLALDLWYLDHQSRRIDLLILLKTVMVVLRGERLRTARQLQKLANRTSPKQETRDARYRRRRG